MKIEVAAGILLRGEQILISERVRDSAFAGLWEFPGGKLDPHELPEEALARELAEELGVKNVACSHFMKLEHRYPDRHVSINFYLVREWTGEPVGLDGQCLRWAHPSDIRTAELLPADAPVLLALRKKG